MKKNIVLILLILVSCQKAAVEKPDQLIEEAIMVDILFDLTVLESAKAHTISNGTAATIQTNEYLYKKYAIDSLQFVQNEKYYAANIKTYKRIFDKVNQRIQDSLYLPEKQKSEKSKTNKAADSDIEQFQKLNH